MTAVPLFPLPDEVPPGPKVVPVRAHERRLEPRARRTDPPTSRNAAARVKPDASALAQLILMQHRYHPAGLTDDELAATVPLSHPPTVKSCRSRLSKAGLLVDSGVERPSLRGVPMTVWRLPAV